MNVTKQLEGEIKQVMNTYWSSYLHGDIETWESYLPDNYSNIGTTEEELWSSKKEIVDYTNAVIDQLKGIVELRDKQTQIFSIEPYFMVHEVGNMYLKTENDWTFYSKLRLSSLLEKTSDGWKILHQHGSYPDAHSKQGETFGFGKLKEENTQLREAVKRRTAELEIKNRELEIEASLERVRAVAMSMHKPDDLLLVAKSLFTELKSLGFIEIRNALINTFNDEKKFFLDYDYSDFLGGHVTTIPYNTHPLIAKHLQQVRKATDAFAETIVTEKELESWIEGRRANGEPDDPRLQNASAMYYYFYSTGPAAIGLSTYVALSGEKRELLKRFRNVFELAYQRYADIEKAEAQAREAKIEYSLEKVRSQAMAMHKSEDLLNVCRVMYMELQALGFEDIRNAMIHTFDDKNDFFLDYDFSGATPGKISQIPTKGHSTVEHYLKEIKKSTDAFLEILMTGAELAKWKQFRRSTGQIEDPRLESADKIYYYYYSIGMGDIGISTFSPISKMQMEILERFRNVFQLSYQRYVDIQKAEAQAREAQIEIGLERVRSRAMAMQSSEELNVLIGTVFTELTKLDLVLTRCIIWVFEPTTDSARWWMSNVEEPLNPMNFLIKYHEHPAYLTFVNGWKKQNVKFVYDLNGQDKIAWDEILFNETELVNLPDVVKNGMRAPERVLLSASFNNFGGINVASLETLSDEHFDILLRFAKVFDLTYTRFLDLKKAEAQAREAQIEAALERIRARSMAMHQSSDLHEVIKVVADQFILLNVKFDSVSFIKIKDDRSWDMFISTVEQPYPANIFIPYIDNKIVNSINEPADAGKEFYTGIFTREEKNNFFNHFFTNTAAKHIPAERQQYVLNGDGYAISFFTTKYITLAIVNYQGNAFNEEANAILKRFAKVFEQTYTRFLDLKTAEAQAKEAQIEASLERVRSKTMAMHQTSELQEVINAVHKELLQLNLSIDGGSFVVINEDVKSELVCWGSGGTANTSQEVQVPHFNMPFCTLLVKGIKAGHGFFTEEFSQEEKKQYFTQLFKHKPWSDLSTEQKEETLSGAGGYTRSVAVSKYTTIFIINHHGRKFTDNENDILKRFANIFEQTYTRFLDLHKAEVQAREAQIEVALERVRAKTMAMHDSQDVSAATAIMFNELVRLGVENMRCGIAILKDDVQLMDVWTATITKDGHNVKGGGLIDLNRHPLWQQMYSGWKAKKENFSYHLKGEDLKAYYKALTSSANYSAPYINEDPPEHFCYVTYFDDGVIFTFNTFQYSDEQKQILKRFASVFNLTYRRYLDLQKAEAQAREAQIEAALERVRSRTLAMQKSDELAETSAVLFKQLIGLGIEPNRLYITIVKDQNANAEFWITDEDGSKVSFAYEANLDENTTFKKMYEGWKQQKESLVIDMQGDELQNYFRYLSSLNVSFKGGLEQKRRVQHLSYFSKGFIGMASPEEQPAETIELLKRFAYVFNLTYTRFNDLQMAEAHALQAEQDLIEIKAARKKAEDTLLELQAAQKQLIQSEKMASLGELTAGIAHEIQNPLNFVNNFSEVSKELLDEMKEELATGNLQQATEIATDIIQNLEKINHHGKRADAIVKGMLQHSRSSSNQKEPTDINALADEYLRLAYHGLRAKEKSFNATLETDYDSTIGKIEIIPQDIGRVILNLITNAFYAVSEKQKAKKSSYTPTVALVTRKLNDKVEIIVKDNGNGISQNVVDKIFQPFFTTKPTGQGTGLGLSLAYDIVKAHGGELKVKTKEGEGSEFTIRLHSN